MNPKEIERHQNSTNKWANRIELLILGGIVSAPIIYGTYTFFNPTQTPNPHDFATDYKQQAPDYLEDNPYNPHNLRNHYNPKNHFPEQENPEDIS